jgi:hypothetical protein
MWSGCKPVLLWPVYGSDTRKTKGSALARFKDIRPPGFGSPAQRDGPPKKLRSNSFPLATPDFASSGRFALFNAKPSRL